MPPTLLLALLALLACPLSAHAQPPAPAPSPQLTPADWQADLHQVLTELPKRHKDPFTITTREAFESRAAEIDMKLPTLTDWQSFLAFKTLIATVGDSHTVLYDPTPRFTPHPYPIMLGAFTDGYFVAAADDEHAHLLGHRLIKIGDKTPDEVIAILSPLVGAENDVWLKLTLRPMLTQAEILAGMAIIPDPDHAPFTLAAADGTTQTVTLAPLPPKGNLTKTLPDPAKTPLGITRRNHDTWYGHEMLPNSKILYAWYNKCTDMRRETVAAWGARLIESLNTDHPDKLIIDLRRNSGGNSALLMTTIAALSQHKEINQPGRLFILIGRQTFSSGMMNALQLKNATHALLVGSPTGQKPNSFGEIKSLTLDRTGLTLQYSTKYFRQIKDADPPSLLPDIEADFTSNDFFQGRDPAIDAVKNYAPPSP